MILLLLLCIKNCLSYFKFLDLIVVQPADITFSTGIKVENGGRWRYQYSVSWKVRNFHLLLSNLTQPADI